MLSASATLATIGSPLRGSRNRSRSRAIWLFKEAASASSNLGLFFAAGNNYDKAIQSFQASVQYREKTGDKKNAGLIYGLIGYAHFLSGNFLAADDNFKKGLALMNGNRIVAALARRDKGQSFRCRPKRSLGICRLPTLAVGLNPDLQQMHRLDR